MKPSLLLSPLGLIVITQIVIAILIVKGKSEDTSKSDHEPATSHRDGEETTKTLANR